MELIFSVLLCGGDVGNTIDISASVLLFGVRTQLKGVQNVALKRVKCFIRAFAPRIFAGGALKGNGELRHLSVTERRLSTAYHTYILQTLFSC